MFNLNELLDLLKDLADWRGAYDEDPFDATLRAEERSNKKDRGRIKMTKKRVEWKASLAKDGSLLSYDDAYNNYAVKQVSRDTTWDLTLTFDSFDKGWRSAYRFIGTDTRGRTWPMTISNYIAMSKQVVMDRGTVSGKFGVTKRGSNFSLVYLGAE